MNVLLCNDTRIEENIGCHATVNSLIEFINANIENAIITTIPLGSEYSKYLISSIYKNNNKTLFSKAYRKIKKFTNKHDYDNIVDINLWKKIALNNFSTDTKNKIKKSDLVIINFEGTIHHNNAGALTLLGLAYFSKSLGKKVAMVNGSYQAIDSKLTKKALKYIDFLSVRDPISLRYLKRNAKNGLLIPDFAFKANIDDKINNIDIISSKLVKKKCLYTIGVLGAYPNQMGGIQLDEVIKHIEYIKDIGFVPYFLKIESKEDFIVKELIKLNVKIISNEDGIKWTNIGTLIKSFDLLITGRYHIGIFGVMSNVRTFFLSSNTHKIPGVLEMLNLEEFYLDSDFSDLEMKIKNTKLKDKNFIIDYTLFNSFKEFLKSI